MALHPPAAIAPIRRAISPGFRLPFVLRSAARRWRKMVGATIGVGIALGVVVALMGLASGVLELVAGEYLRSSINLYVIRHGGIIAPVLPGESPGSIDDAAAIVSQVRGMPGVQQVVAYTSGGVTRDTTRDSDGTMRTEPWEIFGVWGNPDQAPGMLDLREGRWVRLGSEIVLSPRLADTKGLHLDDTVTLNGRRLRVVGIGSMRGAGYASMGAAYTGFDLYRALTGAGYRVNMLMIQADRPDEVIARLESSRDLDVYTRLEVRQAMLDVASHDIITSYLFSFFGLGIAALFVGNVLSLSVQERRLELATMRAIGVPRIDVFALVVTEAMAVVIVAYVIGAIVGTILGNLMNVLYAPLLKMGDIVYLDPMLYVQVLGVSIVLGIVASVLPASAVVRIQPAEALREE